MDLALKGLLLLHLAAAVVLMGASGHAAVAAWQIVWGLTAKERLLSMYRKILGWVYPAVFLLGSLIYPAFRVGVRPHFDVELPWATGLFEIKEHAMALALALVVVQATGSVGRPRPILDALLASAVFGTVVWGAFVGALLVSIRSI